MPETDETTEVLGSISLLEQRLTNISCKLTGRAYCRLCKGGGGSEKEKKQKNVLKVLIREKRNFHRNIIENIKNYRESTAIVCNTGLRARRVEFFGIQFSVIGVQN